MANEIWADIIGHPGYTVSNFGRIRNERLNKFLYPHYSEGYKQVPLSTGNNIEFNNEALEDFAKRKRKDDRVKFWVPVIISIAAFIVSILAYLKQG